MAELRGNKPVEESKPTAAKKIHAEIRAWKTSKTAIQAWGGARNP
jgi:hypothetical protein